jgi:alpha-1,3-rhamnosyl/mannosyltransferase
MRIIFDARRFGEDVTGIGRIIDGLLNALVKEDFLNKYLVLIGEKNPLPGTGAANFEVRSINLGLDSLWVNITMPRIASSWKADVAYFPFWLIPLWMPCPTVVAIHDLIYLRYPKLLSYHRRQFHRFYASLAVRSATRIHSLSSQSKSDLVHFFGAEDERIDIIPPDADLRFRKRSLISSELEGLALKGILGPFALYVGNHKPHKNLEGLLRAYQLIAGQIEANLVIVGTKASQDDFQSLPYLCLCKELFLVGRVRFVGQVNDEELILLYNAAKFIVFPSLYEGFGLPPLEAMRCGTPVICSGTSSLPEVVGEAALTFDPQDISDMANVMLKVDQSAQLREELIQRGTEQARLFSWRFSARKWLASLERAAQNGKDKLAGWPG